MFRYYLIALALMIVTHGYVAYRLLSPSGLGRFGRGFFYGLFALLALSAPQVFVVGELLAFPYDMIARWTGWIYIGAFSILLALVIARDLSLLALRGVDVLRAKQGRAPLVADPARRRFLLRTTGTAALGVTGAVTAWGAHTARKLPEIVQVDVPIVGLPEELDGYHIVQLSDVHVGETIDKDFILPIVEQVTSLAPDLVVLTGDLIDGTVPELRADVTPLSYLRARDGVLCVLGNHEYYQDVEAWCARFRELGLEVLINQHVVIERGDKKLVVAGVTDLREGKRVPGHASDPRAALAGAPSAAARILLAHQPRSIAVARTLGYDLQLSGHTHGGQFFPWNLLIGLVQPLGSGLEKFGDTWLYVNRGTCYWGPPNRAGVPAELTSLRLRRA